MMKKSMTENSIRCDSCAVRHRAVCGALSRPEIERLNAIAHHRHLQPGQIILGDSEPITSFSNIVSGVVKLSKTLPDGREQIVGLQFASDFLGRPFRSLSPYRAEAVTETHLCSFEKGQFERLAREHQGLEHRLFANTLDELDSAQEWMLLLGRKSAAEKVASFLMMVARRMRDVGCEHAPPNEASLRFDLPLTRAEIADFLGLTIETVSRQFSRLKQTGLISVDGARSIRVNSFERLASASEHAAP